MAGRRYKIVKGLMGYEVHGRHAYSFDDQAAYNHIATHTNRKSAQDQVKFLTEKAKTTDKELMKEKRAADKGYGAGHDMNSHGEGKPYNES